MINFIKEIISTFSLENLKITKIGIFISGYLYLMFFKFSNLTIQFQVESIDWIDTELI